MDGGIAAMPDPSKSDDVLVLVPRGAGGLGLGALRRPDACAVDISGRETLAWAAESGEAEVRGL